jgi:hypothetical protein
MVSILDVTSGVFFHSSGVSFGAVVTVKREGTAKRRKLNPFILRIFLIDEGVAFTSSIDQGTDRFG